MTTVNAVNTYIVPTAAREVTMPSQPAFSARPPNVPTITGTGTVYQYGTDAMTEFFDQNADFDPATGILTSPVTGKYYFHTTSYVGTCTINTSCKVILITSNRSYQGATWKPADNQNESALCDVLADMDAADTATCSVVGTGEVADTEALDAISEGVVLSCFGGNLVC